MSVDYGSFTTAIKEAAGEDVVLMSELRIAFFESADRQIDLLSRSRCDANWQYSAWRLQGLAASFGAEKIKNLAHLAVDGAPGDPVILRELRTAIETIKSI